MIRVHGKTAGVWNVADRTVRSLVDAKDAVKAFGHLALLEISCR